MRQRNALPALLTPAEVCATLRISRATPYRMVARGDLEVVRLGSGSGATLRVPVGALDPFLAAGKTRFAPPGSRAPRRPTRRPPDAIPHPETPPRPRALRRGRLRRPRGDRRRTRGDSASRPTTASLCAAPLERLRFLRAGGDGGRANEHALCRSHEIVAVLPEDQRDPAYVREPDNLDGLGPSNSQPASRGNSDRGGTPAMTRTAFASVR
jgi:excisionase family DNA binding protein